jgi:hypothetical protein
MDKQGTVYRARPSALEGAHALGFNLNSIGLCYYTNNGFEDAEIIDKVSALIDAIKGENENLQILSHTQAQLIHINRLLEKGSLNERFPTTPDVCNPQYFSELKSNAEELARTLKNPDQRTLRILLKNLKNCPGGSFRHFV